jgi:uncharacterized protein YjdB
MGTSVRRVGKIITILLTTAGACSDPARPAEPVAVFGIRVLPQTLQLSGVGDTATIAATIVPADATDRAIIWESSDPQIVDVSTTGHITAKAVGVGVFITAYSHDGLHQASANVSVNP